MKQALIYSLKAWATALLLTPILSFPIWWLAEVIISLAHWDQEYSTGIAYGININVSTIGLNMRWFALFYVPVLVVLFLFVNYLQRGLTTMRYKKMAFTALVVVLTLSPFTFLKVIEYNVVFNMQLARVISFGLVLIAGIWFYKLKPTHVEPSNQITQ